eukprot:jgi/Botrbrau1/13801/Bobra.0056s0049.1
MSSLYKIYPNKDYLTFDRHDMSIGGEGHPNAQKHLRLHNSKNTMFRQGTSLFPQRIYDGVPDMNDGRAPRTAYDGLHGLWVIFGATDRPVHLYTSLLEKGGIPEALFFVVDSYEDAKALADKVKPKRIWPSLGWTILVAWKMCRWPEGNPPKTHVEEWTRIVPSAGWLC